MKFSQLIEAMKKAKVTLVKRDGKSMLVPTENVTAEIISGAKTWKAELTKKFFPPTPPKQETIVPDLDDKVEGSYNSIAMDVDAGLVKAKQKNSKVALSLNKEDAAKLIRIHNSGRLRICKQNEKIDTMEHYFLNGVLRNLTHNPSLEIHHATTANRIIAIINKYGDDKDLNYIDAKAIELGDNYKHWAKGYYDNARADNWQGDAFEEMHQEFGLEQWVGKAMFLPLNMEVDEFNLEQVENSITTFNHCWLVDENCHIVDPLWKLLPGRIFCYSGTLLF